MGEDIRFRDIVGIIINGKRIVVGIFVITILTVGIINFFLLPENYEAKATLIFDKKFIEQQGLTIKNYNNLIMERSNLDYLYSQSRLNEKGYSFNHLQKALETKIDEKSNEIIIGFTGQNPEISQEIVNKLGERSVIVFKQRLIDEKERQIEECEKQLGIIQENMKKTSQLLGASEIRNGNGQIVQVPQVNPMYEKLSSRWDEVNYRITQLKAEKEYLEKGIQTGGKGLYIILNKSSLPDEPVSPRRLLNTALAGVLSLIVSISIVFFVEYWKKTE